MANRITPSLGPDVDQISTQFYWDTINDSDKPSYQLGSKVKANDGYEYMFVKAGGSNIAANTQVQVATDGTFVATAGSGGFYTRAAVPANSFFHARRGNTLQG